jgi:hypothetical protein
MQPKGNVALAVKKTVARFYGFPILARIAGLLPMAVALATLPAIDYFFADSYRA